MPKEPLEESVLVVEVPNVTKDELWGRVNSWCIDAFKDSTNVVQFTDKEAGVIRGKFTGRYDGYFYQYVQTTFSAEVKDFKARLKFYDATRIVMGDIMFGAYYQNSEIPVYTTDVNLIEKIKADWTTLAKYFEIKLTSTEDDW